MTVKSVYRLTRQGRSQEFVKGDKRGGLRDESNPAGFRDRAPVVGGGLGAKPPEAGDMLLQ